MTYKNHIYYDCMRYHRVKNIQQRKINVKHKGILNKKSDRVFFAE